jgi:hypothetical protein
MNIHNYQQIWDENQQIPWVLTHTHLLLTCRAQVWMFLHNARP